MPNKPTIPEVAPLVERYRARHGVSGPLHCLMDDGNFEEIFVEHGRELALARGDAETVELCDLLLRMSKTQRLKLSRRY